MVAYGERAQVLSRVSWLIMTIKGSASLFQNVPLLIFRTSTKYWLYNSKHWLGDWETNKHAYIHKHKYTHMQINKYISITFVSNYFFLIFDVISDLWCNNCTKNFPISFTQFPQTLTFYFHFLFEMFRHDIPLSLNTLACIS